METWEFGRMLRRLRDRVAPEAVGVPAGQRRRAAGLRREELAALAGISTDYLTRLEQGRATSPSAQIVEALARGLRVTDAERELLYELAGLAAPGPDLIPTRIPASVHRLLDRFDHIPVAVFDAAMTLIVANRPYDALMGDTSSWRGIERNAVWRNIVGPGSRAVLDDDEHGRLQSNLVANLRMTAARYPADRALGRLVDELGALSRRFVELWEADGIQPTPDQSRRKIIEHPDVGPITLDCDTLVVAADDLRIMVYTAEPGSADAERLNLAIVLGTQAIAGSG